MAGADGGSITIPILSWIDRPVKEAVYSVFSDLNNSTEALDLFRRYRNSHFRTLRSQVKKIKILGMSTPEDLVDIYSPAFVSTTIWRRLYDREWYSLLDRRELSSKKGSKKPPINVRADEYLEEHDRVVILGGPGSGKTTLLRFLSLAYCTKDVFKKTKLKTSYFPIFVSLPVYANSKLGLFGYVCDDLKKKTDDRAEYFLKRVLKHGQAVILLDSLDEVSPKKRKYLCDKILDFCDRYPDCKVVLSCRTADYKVVLESFYEVEMARLEPEAVEQIIRVWFRKDPKKSRDLIRHIRADPGVASLTETPLLLSLLCIQFRHDLTLPKRKAEVYRRCVDALLREWDTDREFRRDSAYASLTDDRKEKIFGRVAEMFFVPQPTFVFPEEAVVKVISDYIPRFGLDAGEAQGVLDEIECHHGILERFSASDYTFSHPTFHEYFAAQRFVVNRVEIDVVREHYGDEEWSNVIEFMVARREDPTDILEFLSRESSMTKVKQYPAMARRTRLLWLLYRCLAVGANIEPEFRKGLNDHLVMSQVQMADVYQDGGAYPIAVLMEDGVRHAFYYVKQRPTLRDALQPFRKLSNEILLSPSHDYGAAIVRYMEKLEYDWPKEMTDAAALCSLVVPAAGAMPHECRKYLRRLGKLKGYDFFSDMVVESLEVLERVFV